MRVLDQILEVLAKNLPEYFSLHQTKRRKGMKKVYPWSPLLSNPALRYEITWLHLDPLLGFCLPCLQFHDFLSFVVLRFSFGAPISRNRIYLLLLRRDLMLKRCKENFAQFASGISEALGMKPECTWLSVCSLIGSP